MYCRNCGSEVSEGQVVCLKCGHSLAPEQKEQKEQKKKGKSKIGAGLMGIFLPFGIHNFYLGFTGKGVAQLLLSCVWVGIIWSFIEGICILASHDKEDANGVPLE